MDKKTPKKSISLSNRDLLMMARASDDDEINQFDDDHQMTKSHSSTRGRLGANNTESYQFAGIHMTKAAAAPSLGGNVKLPSTAQLQTEMKNPNCALSDTSETNEDANLTEGKPRLADVVNTLSGREVSDTLRQSPVIQSALRQREVASSPNLKDTPETTNSVLSNESRSGVGGKRLDMNLFGPVTHQRLSSSQMLKGCLVNKAPENVVRVHSLPGDSSSSPPMTTSSSSADGETSSARRDPTGMAKWKYPTHKSFIVDMNNPPNYDAAKSVSFEVRERRPLQADTISTASTLDIADAVVSPDVKDVVTVADKVNTSDVYYPPSSTYHHSTAGGGKDKGTKSLYDRVGPIGLVAAGAFCLLLLVLICVLVNSTNAIRHDMEDIKSKLASCEDCLVRDVVTDAVE